MESKNPNVIKVEDQNGEWRMETNIEIEEELIKKFNRLKSGLKVMAVVGIGAGLYGFKLGRQSGFRKGVKDGYLTAGNEFISALREHHEELKGSLRD